MIRPLSLVALAVALLAVSQASQAAFIVYVATLNGPNESPPTSSPGTGSAEVDIDTVANTMRVRVSFSGLESNTTASHIHSPTTIPFMGTVGVATTTPTFPNFPLSVTSGTYDQTLDLTQASSYNPSFVTANGGTTASAEAALLSSIAAGTSYLNIHTTMFGGGAIRGFLVPAAAVPEPASIFMLAAGVLGVIAYGRRVAARKRAG
jgi:hypothetical protein